ncbi:allatotropin-like isoform X3 [Leptidea sinapis]|uniref:allatotropin-like isoform X3 n=1 Tax=Leptidea sinapis TaxID=189913 RepID=UPI002137A66E|nr:allatotropin-like isoform X3 [Leptidea sinapis]
MNVTMQLAVMVAVCLCLAEAAPVGRLTRSKQQRPTRGFKNVEMMTARGFGKRARTERDVVHQRTSERTSRGIPIFKSPSVGIARDFGKRTPELESEDESRKTFKPRCMHLMTAKDFGKRSDNNDVNDEVYGMDNFWESLEGTQEKDGQETDEKPVESIPMDWFVNEMLNNPDFARSVVRKFVDQNQDGILSADELLRNTA